MRVLYDDSVLSEPCASCDKLYIDYMVWDKCFLKYCCDQTKCVHKEDYNKYKKKGEQKL